MTIRFIVLLLMFASSHMVSANNIQITNISLLNQDTDANHTQIQFDIGWENSWRLSSGPSNYDGAWVFVKYRKTGGDWRHATINYVDGMGTGDGHVVPAGSVVQTTSDGVGAFVFRDSDGSGDISFAGLQLRWNYGADLVGDNDVVDVRVFALEMVYVPTGTYPLGSNENGSEAGHFYTNTGIFGFQGTYQVNSEAAISVSTAVNDLYYNLSGDQLGPIPAAFPKGYQAFWCMKYEMTEEQYVGFFNTLTEQQKTVHDITAFGKKNTDNEFERNTVSYTIGNATSSAPARAVSFMSYEDCAAYLDWAGLRFLTELEFEKACKGPVHKINMLASGGTVPHPVFFTISNDGTNQSLVTNMGEHLTNMNYTFSSLGGPMRVGIFAASSINNTREESGGSYYGIMELSGNLYERSIGVGTPLNRSYTGEHGDGFLSTNGSHNVLNWPADGSEGAVGYRGGSWGAGNILCAVADRSLANLTSSSSNGFYGIRGCRTAQ